MGSTITQLPQLLSSVNAIQPVSNTTPNTIGTSSGPLTGSGVAYPSNTINILGGALAPTITDPVDPMEAMYVNTFGFNPFPKYGFNSYMDYNTARITGTPMNQNISDLEDYLGTLESAREINLPGVTKDLSAEDISRLQEEYIKERAKTANALNPTVTASTLLLIIDNKHYQKCYLDIMLVHYQI
jgi:hypothetical protein